jgi:hypothetical protein
METNNSDNTDITDFELMEIIKIQLFMEKLGDYLLKEAKKRPVFKKMDIDMIQFPKE